ncbi:PAS domain-containing sensor histidine kinase [Rhizobium sp. SL86]|uniref:PAS domain-containing sensor histidine kinase n=1 Tax=Rhizobium sp. SL86 TaxID=2995148 RepID=UPI0022766489|nr:ATP-binding protein [Rhizobium sp. SL86]MCY1664650.1 PAS domain S-box protein [Rhizobium sp. SL86]
MSSVQYPFIDIAVHERIRAHFAAGKALVLFSTDMAEVLWANGRGARLFGRSSIYDLMDQGPIRVDLTYRQALSTARGLRAAGETRTFMIRMTEGFERIGVTAVCERITLPGGGEGILFAAPAGAADPKAIDCARQMLEGFDDPQTHIAVLNADGEIISASPSFAALQLTPQTARMLVTLAGHDRERLVKRPVPTAAGYLPGAIARLSDEPALNLLFLVQPEDGAPENPVLATEEKAPSASFAAAPAFEDALEAVSAIDELEEDTEEDPDFTEDLSAPGVSETDGDETIAVNADTEEPADAAPAAEGNEPDLPAEIQPEAQEALVEETVSSAALEPVAEDFDAPAAQDDVEETVNEPGPVTEEPVAEVRAPAVPFQPDMRATRFVWKIDAQGRFREISPELAAAVGPHAAEVVGLAFTDVAALFNLDPEGRITELLNRRDTWSGKTIRWPIEGTSLAVPIDLAALPTYTRNRDFDGFRGFGIIRMADLHEDPLATGLTLAPEEGMTDEIEADAGSDLPHESDADSVPEISTDSETVEEAAAIPAEPPFPPFHLPDQENEADLQPAEEPGVGALEAEEDTTLDAVPDADFDTDAAANEPADEPEPLPAPTAERPVLRIIDNPGRRHSDKVVRFEEHRSPLNERLSPSEQANFREIARRLDVFRRADDVVAETDTPETPSEATAPQMDDQAEDASTVADAMDAAPAMSAPEETTEHPAVTDQDSVAEEPADTTEPHEADGEPAITAETDAEPAADDSTETIATEIEDHDTDEPADAEEAPLSIEEAYAQAIPLRPRPQLSADVVDQMPVALLVHAGDRLIHGNPEFLRLTGYDSLEALTEVGGLDALLQRQDLEDKTAEAGGMVVVRADDALVPVSARLQSVRWDNASALILALMPTGSAPQDLQALPHAAGPSEEGARQADEVARLKVEVDELRAILDTATDGVVIIGADGDIRSMNRAASALFNYDSDETTGKPFVMLFAHESQKHVMDYLSGLSGHGVASLLNDGREVIGREASGGFVPLFMTIGHLTSSNGYCAVIRDITQWKRTEEELRSAKRAAETASAHKTEFLAHVSHEIRTPLNAIIGFADMMATERLGQIGHPRYVEYANDIGRSGRHVLDIVNDLLDISKIEAGEMDLDFASVGLNETVSEAVSLVQPQANGQRVIIRTALSQSVPPVVADLRSIKQIVLNILSNAIRFTPSGGQIVVSTAYEANGSVVLRVRDTGIGMTRAELDLAMKPFRQVAGASRKRGDGTGLGLPLTKAMVDANRANFSIHSAPNEGTLVEVTFPSPRVLAN